MLATMVFTLFDLSTAERTRRATKYRQEHSHLIPKNFATLSSDKDNVIAMVGVHFHSNGWSKSKVRSTLSSLFTHGCHCGWNFGRHQLADKNKNPRDDLDQICLQFDQCTECLKYDKCGNDAFTPLWNETSFTCDHLPINSCQRNACLCSVSMVNQLATLALTVTPQKLSFTEFMDTCVSEVDPAINTQMRFFGSEGNNSRQCCGEYPQRTPYTYTGLHGVACCAGTQLYNQKFDQCCSDGNLLKVGDIC